MRSKLYSIVLGLIRPVNIGKGGSSSEPDLYLSRRLRILGSAPEPDLERVRKKVIVEAAKLESRSGRGADVSTRPITGYSIASMLLVLGAGVLVFWMPGWNFDKRSPSVTAMNNTEAVRFSTRVVTESSESDVNIPTPEIVPAPRSAGVAVKITTGTGEHSQVVAGTPGPF